MQVPSKSVVNWFHVYDRPEEDVKVGYLDYSIMGVSWESGKQERSVDIRYEADVISLTGDGHESSIPVILLVGVSVLKKYGEEDDE